MIRIEVEFEGQKRELNVGDDVLTIGRSSDNIVCVPDKKASRKHAKIERTPEGYVLRDLESGNGTRHNGAKVAEAPLRAGDLIEIGGTRIRVVEVIGVAPAPAPVEVASHDPVSMADKAAVKRKIEDRLSGRPPMTMQKKIAYGVAACFAVVIVAAVAKSMLSGGGSTTNDTPVAHRPTTPPQTPAEPASARAEAERALAQLRSETSRIEHVSSSDISHALELSSQWGSTLAVEGDQMSTNPFDDIYRNLVMRRAQELASAYSAAMSAVDRSIETRDFRGAYEALRAAEQVGAEDLHGAIAELNGRLNAAVVAEKQAVLDWGRRLVELQRTSEAADYYARNAERFGTAPQAQELSQLATDTRRLAEIPNAPVAVRPRPQPTLPTPQPQPGNLTQNPNPTPTPEPATPEPPAPEPTPEPAAPALAAIDSLNVRVIDAIGTGRLTSLRIDLGENRRGSPVAATEQAVTFAVAGQQSEVAWSDMAAAVRSALLRPLMADLTDDEKLAYAQFCLDSGLAEAHEILFTYWNRDDAKKARVDEILASHEGVSVPADGYRWEARLHSFEHPIAYLNRTSLERAERECTSISRGTNLRGVDRHFHVIKDELLAQPELLADTRTRIVDMTVAALNEHKARAVEAIQRRVRQRSGDWNRILQAKRELDTRRAHALEGIYDTTLYPDENHGAVGQPEIDRRVNAVREIWNSNLAAQIDPDVEQNIREIVELNNQYLRDLGQDPGDDLADFQDIVNNITGQRVVTIKNFAMTAAERELYTYDRAVSAYNTNGQFVLPQGVPHTSIEQCEVNNEYREMQGRRYLFLEPALCRAAQKHSEAMAAAGSIWHEGPDGTPSSRCSAEGYNGPAGENVAMGYDTPDAVFDGWYHSSGHHRNMLNDAWNCLGVGNAQGNFWTQDFGVSTVPQWIQENKGHIQ